MDRDAPRLAVRLGEHHRFLAEHEDRGAAEKMRGNDEAAAATVRALDDGMRIAAVSVMTDAPGLASRIASPMQGRLNYAMQLSKPSVIFLPGRLRPMKTMRLSRFSSFFHGRW